jgi:hypothetical protein
LLNREGNLLESGAEGMFSKEDEVVTRQPYGNVWLDHLLSKRKSKHAELKLRKQKTEVIEVRCVLKKQKSGCTPILF